MEVSTEALNMLNNIPKKTTKYMNWLIDSELGHLGLRYYHAIVIRAIGSNQGTSQKNVMENIPLTKARISTIVSELIGKGYVLDTSNGRTSSLHLTEDGESVLLTINELLYEHQNDVLSVLTDDESKVFQTIIFKVNARLEELLMIDITSVRCCDHGE